MLEILCKCKEQFGLEWEAVLKNGKALNAKRSCDRLEIDADARMGNYLLRASASDAGGCELKQKQKARTWSPEGL